LVLIVRILYVMAFNSYDYTQLELHINFEDKRRCALLVVVKERCKTFWQHALHHWCMIYTFFAVKLEYRSTYLQYAQITVNTQIQYENIYNNNNLNYLLSVSKMTSEQNWWIISPCQWGSLALHSMLNRGLPGISSNLAGKSLWLHFRI